MTRESNHTRKEPANRTAQYSSATFLLNQGCDVRIDAKHAIAYSKIILIDNRTVITGSFNFTKAAEESNAENLLVIRDNPRLMERYQANFREHQAHGEAYTGPAKAEATSTPEAEPAHPGRYVGSKNSAVYHLPGCKDVEKISPSNRVEYDEPPPGKRLHKGCPR